MGRSDQWCYSIDRPPKNNKPDTQGNFDDGPMVRTTPKVFS